MGLMLARDEVPLQNPNKNTAKHVSSDSRENISTIGKRRKGNERTIQGAKNKNTGARKQIPIPWGGVSFSPSLFGAGSLFPLLVSENKVFGRKIEDSKGRPVLVRPCGTLPADHKGNE